MKKIIIPLELLNPEEERRTILYGAKMARDLGMGIVLTHKYRSARAEFAYGTSMVEGYPRHDPAELVQERDELIKKSLQAYQLELSQLKEAPPSTEFHILRNSYADHPATREGEDGASFVLLPRKTLLSSSVLQGSRLDTEEYEFGDTPILVHPKESRYSPIRKIIYGTNYHEYDLELLKRLTNIYGKKEIEIDVLHITDDLDFEARIKQAGYLQVVRNKTGNPNINISTLVLNDKSEAVNSLHSYAFEKDAGMIAVLVEKKNLLEKILEPATVNNAVADSTIPVMIFWE